MSQSNKKLLVSGCGFSYSGQERRTWVNVLRSVGANIVDVGGPAVSNQWIINKVFVDLLSNSYDVVIIQLTSIGKLDVEVDYTRELTLVKADSLRNFTHKGVWPSSHSQEHPAKKMYMDLLYSPSLEIEDLFCKILMLSAWCQQHNTKLIILQGYEIEWTKQQKQHLENIISNINDPLYNQYIRSPAHQYHDFANQNTVPCIQYQADLARDIADAILPELTPQVQKIQAHYTPS